jgi:hypothetical protein
MRGAGRLLLLGATGLLACGTGSDSSTPRPSITGPSFSASSANVQGATGERVTGNATILLPQFGNAMERFSLSAIRHKDGTVTGEFEETSEQDGGQRIHAQVVCFGVTGRTARLAARIDQTNVSFGPVGSYVVWSVIDNGEGAKSPPDQTTDVFFNGTAAQADFHCRTGFPLAPYFSSLRGNLQVQ